MGVIGISTYVISDIHGEYDKFVELLDKIKLQDTDTLYILGDILDRGPHPIKTLLKIMNMRLHPIYSEYALIENIFILQHWFRILILNLEEQR